ncbi:hypothetical protein Bcsk_005750 [Bartonella sp. CDC_skunk]|nr:hypothetical protein Bcsk_005750 [Bartonella sp. CDC_skunk]AQX26483.1 hypothetical protein Bra60_004690 [Bartonella sp. Raccoon60]
MTESIENHLEKFNTIIFEVLQPVTNCNSITKW